MAFCVLNWVGGSWVLCGVRAKRHSLTPASSRHSVSMALPLGGVTVTSCAEKVTLQSASHMGTMPTSECLKLGITYPVMGKSCASCGVAALDVVDERAMWTLAVPTCTLGDDESSFGIGESGA